MEEIFILIFIFILCCILWSLPLYLCTNLVLWAFNISYHLTLFQAFTLCLFANLIHKLLFKSKEGK